MFDMDDTVASSESIIASESGKIPLVPINASTQILLTSGLDAPLQSVNNFPFLLVLGLLHSRVRISDEDER